MSIVIETKYLDRRGWRRVTDSDFVWMELETPELSGVAGLLHIKKVAAPLTVRNLGLDVKIADDGFYWLEIAPKGEHWWLTAMYTPEREPIQYYFDITRRNTLRGGGSSFEDLMLDVVLLSDDTCGLMDMDELDAALEAGNITRSEHRLACAGAQKLMEELPRRAGELRDFCGRTLDALMRKLNGRNIMKVETACGAVLFTRQNGKRFYLLIHQNNGDWGFPKGHMEGNETERETARREIWEEVGLRPAFWDGFRTVDEYPLPEKPGVTKRVVFFLAEYGGEPFALQEEELSEADLLPLEQALERLSFDSSRRVLREADDYLALADIS